MEEMRRKDKEIKDKKIINDIIKNAKICRIALSDKNKPYVISMCFGYEDNSFYFHSANEGRKLDILRTNPNICVEISADYELVTSGKACDFGMKYRSIIASGKAVFIDDLAGKKKALEIIMNQYSNMEFDINESAIQKITVFKAVIAEMSCKIS
jgi:uncharacterized protein